MGIFSRMTGKPRLDPDGYPLDLDASLRYTRFATGVAFYPYPPMIGAISGILPQFNTQVLELNAYGKNPFGPNVGTGPLADPVQIAIQGLSKVSG